MKVYNQEICKNVRRKSIVPQNQLQIDFRSFDLDNLNNALAQTRYILGRTIQHAKLHNKKIYLAFSGGKDSLVLNHICKKFFKGLIGGVDYILTHNMTGIDEKETYQFLVKNYNWNGREKSKKQVLKIAPPKEKFFDGLKRIKQLPSKFMRWCCDTCKHKNNKSNEKGNIVLLGIRAAESAARKKRYDWFNQDGAKGNLKYKCIMDIDSDNDTLKVNPLLHWTNNNIWDYIELHSIELPQGYDFENRRGRKGCYLCPFQSKKEMFKQWMSDLPFVRLYKKVMNDIMRGKHGEYKHPWRNVDIWAAFVWFIDIRSVIKNAGKDYINRKTVMKESPESNYNYDYYYYYYYYYYYLKENSYYLCRNDKWFKDVCAELGIEKYDDEQEVYTAHCDCGCDYLFGYRHEVDGMTKCPKCGKINV